MLRGTFAWVARKQDPELINKVKALNLKGVYVQKEFKRFYPDNQMASEVLGYVGLDDNGLGGLEENFDDDLHGTPGHMLTALDARRHVLGSEESEPLPGENLVLTLDANIQFMAEQALDRNMERTHALNGTVVVQDPHTGQILALAIRPTFNPNDFRHATKDLLRDHAVSDVYEPGSTFKLVTYSAALEEHVATPDGMVDCGGGQINVAGRIVHDAPGEHFGNITVAKALAESSDVAAIRLAQRMGPDRFYKYIKGFGFGQRSEIELPDETTRTAETAAPLESDDDRLDSDGAGGRGDTDSAGDDGVDHCEWRRVSAAAHPAEEHGPDERRSKAAAGGVSSGDRSA